MNKIVSCIHAFVRYLNNSLVRGFALTAILLLGIGLEQGLLPGAPDPEVTFWFLSGNIAGLPFGYIFWKSYNHKWKSPLYVWLIAGIGVSICAWKQFYFLFAFLGLIFGVLILHLAILGLGMSIENLIPPIATGIALGNILLFILEHLPFPLGLAWLAVALAGWRIKRPNPEFMAGKEVNFPSVNLGLYWFWLFFLCFYVIGGFYYNKLSELIYKATNQDLIDILSLIFYVLGLFFVMFFGKKHLRLNPYIAIMAMGLCITLQLTPQPYIIYFFPFIDFGFGIMDCFVLAVIFAFSQNLLRASIGLALFPIAIISGMFLGHRLAGTPLTDCQWILTFLFLTMIPLHFSMRTLIKYKKFNIHHTLLALPPPVSDQKIEPAAPKTEKRDSTRNLTKNPNKNFVHNSLSKKEIQEFAQQHWLSQREYQVLQGLAVGKKLKEIADDLGLALGTIKAITKRIYEKAEVKGKKELQLLFRKTKKSPKK